jgi:hypothetical protein
VNDRAARCGLGVACRDSAASRLTASLRGGQRERNAFGLDNVIVLLVDQSPSEPQCRISSRWRWVSAPISTAAQEIMQPRPIPAPQFFTTPATSTAWPPAPEGTQFDAEPRWWLDRLQQPS